MKIKRTRSHPFILQLETRGDPLVEIRPLAPGGIMVTPPINEGFWLFRVMVSDRQAVVGFPKFMTCGIGFAQETDWNTNLPASCSAEEIYRHIRHNKGDVKIPQACCLKAIEMIQEAWQKAKS